jgi:hypothetical protein
MPGLIDANEKLEPVTDEEKSLANRVFTLRPGPFTSLNLCGACATSMASPGMRVVARYGDLAAAIDADYFAILAED